MPRVNTRNTSSANNGINRAENPETNELSKVITLRGTLESRLARFIEFVDNFEAQDEVNELNVRLEAAKTNFERLEEVHEHLKTHDPVTEYDTHHEAIESQYFRSVGKAKKISHDREAVIANNENVAAHISDGSNFNANTPNKFGVKVPALKLATFDGSFDNWMPFKDAFLASIDKNPQLQQVQKLLHLRSLLIDKAKGLLDHLAPCDTNYTVGWKLLNDRYDNKRYIILAHMKAIFDLPRVHRGQSELQQFVDAIQMRLGSLEALGEKVSEWNTPLIQLAISRIDTYTHSEWEKTLTNTEMPTWESMLSFLHRRCQIYQAQDAKPRGAPIEKYKNNGYNHTDRNNSSFKTANRSRFNSFFNSASTERAHKGQNKGNKFTSRFRPYDKPNHPSRVNCLLCNQPHFTDTCTLLSTLKVPERWSLIREKKLCANCFRDSHQAADCKIPIACKKCNRKHNTVLHNDNASGTQGNAGVISSEKSSCFKA